MFPDWRRIKTNNSNYIITCIGIFHSLQENDIREIMCIILFLILGSFILVVFVSIINYTIVHTYRVKGIVSQKVAVNLLTLRPSKMKMRLFHRQNRVGEIEQYITCSMSVQTASKISQKSKRLASIS